VRALVAGWFSFPEMGATAGDLMARDVVRGWLDELGVAADVAVAPPFSGGVDWTVVDPGTYSHVVFVCGPFGNGWPLTDFLERFRACTLIGVDVSMLQPVEEWNPFAHLIERDSTRRTHPDLAFLAEPPRVPVVGLCLVHPQKEYGKRGRHPEVHEALERLVARHDVAVVRIDTRLDENAVGLRSTAQIESLIARVDVVVTTRLHGLVLALKNGVPALAVDPIDGGAKIAAQGATVEWPTVLTSMQIDDEQLDRAFQFCLTAEARDRAGRARGLAADRLRPARAEFVRAFEGDTGRAYSA
jgi:hypothetical protein